MLGQRLERRVEHPQDVRGLVRDDLVRLRVPQHRRRGAIAEVGLGRLVRLGQESEVRGVIRVLAAREFPAALVAIGIDDGHADRVLQAHQLPRDDRAVGPRARPAHEEVVPPRLRADTRSTRRLETQSRKSLSCRLNEPSSAASWPRLNPVAEDITPGSYPIRLEDRLHRRMVGEARLPPLVDVVAVHRP